MAQYEDDATGTADDGETADVSRLTLRDNVLLYGDLPVGRVDDDGLTINLGWAALARLSVRVEGNPSVDRTRTGLVLDRPAQ